MHTKADVLGNALAPRRRANGLAGEKSPYLLQHQFNPVAWQPWGAKAFQEARTEQKPIFLSIGYSTCHWCHVMERESFEDDKVAEFLNAHFVSIKVDREERPDVDKIYMNFVQATTGQGGWPLNAFLTPDLQPFFGGTYFPPANLHGRPGFLQLLQHIQQLWSERRKDVAESARDMHSRLEQSVRDSSTAGEGSLSEADLRRAGEQLKSHYDPKHGGFGNAPKFPQPSHPQFLLRYGTRFNDTEAVRMVLHTCERMAAGGIHDQLGGGFSRYSVDAEWLVPHFEKMLYDNAQLADLYLDAFLASGDKQHAAVVRDIMDYVLSDMTHPQGGFFCAEDADSEGQEGKFYCWTHEELKRLLEPEELEVAVRHFGITAAGNFVDHSHPHPLRNLNVLSVADPKLKPSERRLLNSAKEKMKAARNQRVRPGLDDKVLASWNGLMLGAMARAGCVLGEERYLTAAMRNFDFLKSALWDEKARRLYHRWRYGERDSVVLLEGYAFLLSGVLELYQATLAGKVLEFAVALAQTLLERFHDSEHGGFWQGSPEATDLILRFKEAYDGAEPSGNSVAILALLKLGKITGQDKFTTAAEKSLKHFAPRLQQLPQAVPHLLQALDFWLQEPVRIVVAGDIKKGNMREWLRAAHSVYLPNKIVMSNSGPVEAFAKTLPTRGGQTAYLCTGNSCREPAGTADVLKRQLREVTAGSQQL